MALLTEQDISDEERAAFKLYKSNSPFERSPAFTDALNEALALGKPLSDGFARQKELLDRMFDRSSLPHEVTLYRATWDGYLTRHINGDVLRYPPFMSTGLDQESVHRHFGAPFTGPALLVIRCQAGARALNGEMLASTFGNSLEREILLPAGAFFRIEGVDTITDANLKTEHMSAFFGASHPTLKVYRLSFLPTSA